jgi:hypothetical protein
MSIVGALPIHQPGSVLAIRVFTGGCRGLWVLLASLTVLVETVPVPPMAPAPFYAYCAGKVLLFAVLGFGVPLAFASFNAMNRGIIFAVLSACTVEALQAVVGRGHSFHWYELLVKLFLLLLGFALALNARYDHVISCGPLRIRLNF